MVLSSVRGEFQFMPVYICTWQIATMPLLVSDKAPLDLDAGSGDQQFHKQVKASWARLIRKVYEVDPLVCPRCGGEMRPIAIVEQALVIELILRHVGAWDPQPPIRSHRCVRPQKWWTGREARKSR